MISWAPPGEAPETPRNAQPQAWFLVSRREYHEQKTTPPVGYTTYIPPSTHRITHTRDLQIPSSYRPVTTRGTERPRALPDLQQPTPPYTVSSQTYHQVNCRCPRKGEKHPQGTSGSGLHTSYTTTNIDRLRGYYSMYCIQGQPSVATMIASEIENTQQFANS
jgi:hypothetical protein